MSTIPFPNPDDLERESELSTAATGVTVINGAAIKPQPVDWLWPGWVAKGKMHLLAGAPGTGKTLTALALTATVTTGGRWPDGSRARPEHVLIWSGEDDPSDTLVPRLMACGADLTKVHFVTGMVAQDGPRNFDPSTDIDALVDHMAVMDPSPAMLIVDPIVSAVAGDSHKNAEVRRALQPLVDLAATRKCALLGITHFTKGSGGRDPVERMTGSLAFGALVRIGLVAAKMPDNEGGGRVLARAKSNIGPDGDGFGYDLDICEPVEGIRTARVLWGEELKGTAREILGKAETLDDPEEQGALNDCVGFLRGMLADGPVPVRQIKKDAEECGHSWATIKRAKQRIGIEPRKEGFGKSGVWKWALPSETPKALKSHHKLSILERDEHLSQESTTYGSKGAQTDEHLNEHLREDTLSKGAQTMSTLASSTEERENNDLRLKVLKNSKGAHQKRVSTLADLNEHLRIIGVTLAELRDSCGEDWEGVKHDAELLALMADAVVRDRRQEP